MPNQVIIPFQPHWQHKMLAGLKTCTSRRKKHGNKGDTFRHFGASFVILTVEKYYLSVIAEYLYKEEGCDSPNEFIKIWTELHPIKGWVPDQKVFVHFFRKED